MPYRCPTWMLGLLALLPTGCAMRGDVEMLESELRRQEQVEQDLAAELKTARDDLRVARSDAENLRVQLSQRGQASLVSEQAEVLFKAEAIKFNDMLTSGANRDGQPGDDGLSVMLQPVDAHGDLIKLVGAIDLELHDLTKEGDSQQVGRWQFSAEEVREHWHRGFLSAGYLFQLDWQSPPSASELTLHAKLTAPDGRKFDATTQVKVDLTGAGSVPIAQTEAAPETSNDRVLHASASEAADGELSAPVARPPNRPRPGRRKGATGKAAKSKGAGHTALETSDNFTDATIPRLR